MKSSMKNKRSKNSNKKDLIRGKVIPKKGGSEALLSDIIASIQDGISILDHDLNIVRVNPTMERWYAHAMPLLGKRCYEAYCRQKERCEICPAYETLQTGKKATGVVPRLDDTGEIVGWFEIHTFPLLDIPSNKIRGVIEYIRDITQSIKDEEELHRKEAILEAISFASKSFLSGIDWDRNVQEVLSRLGKAAVASRAYLFENHVGQDGQLLTSQRYEWAEVGIEPQIDNPQLQGFSFQKFGFERWVERLGKGEVIQGHVKDFPEREREILAPQEIQSILIVPIFVNEKWWGFIGFDECLRERIWGKSEIEALRLAAEILGAAIRHKQAEDSLKESEERYRTILESIEDGYFEVDLAGNLTFFNEPLCRVLGYSRDELMGMNNRQYTDPENSRLLYQAFNQVYRTGIPLKGFEWEVIRKDGEKRFGEVSVSLIRDRVGRPVGFRGIARDTTERRRAEEVLKASEEKYRSIFDNAVVGIYRSSLEGRFLTVNPAMARIFGYESPEEMIDKISDIATQFYANPDQRQGFLYALEKVMGEVLGLEYEALRKDGTKIWIRDSARAVIGKEGHILFLEGFIEDITHRLRAEETLRTERERFKSLSENAPFGMVMIGKDGTFQYINPRFKELFGYDLSDIPNGRTWFRNAYPDPELRHQVISAWLEDLKSSSPGEKRVRIFPVTCKDGKVKIINFIPVQLETGENLMTCEDITELKRAEEALRRTEEQLRHSQKMEAIGRLAGGIAHDFNNLLTVIKGYAELSSLNLDKRDPLYGNLEEILKASERASALTRQLLAFSRRQMLEYKVTNLNTLLKDLDKMLHRILGEDIELFYHLAEDLGKAKTDPGQMEQVILNLAVNARDAMPGGGKLTMETSNVELDEEYARNHLEVKPGPYVRLTVSDSGVGMAPEVKERIFEPFFTTKPKGKGTGLGLSTVYGIVKQMGGHITFYSEPGLGTTFKIYLPRVEGEEDLQWRKEEPGPIPKGCETILLAEDEPSVRDLAARILRGTGYQVEVAKDGQEALQIIQRQPGKVIDLLLTDVVMPGMSGRELADRMKTIIPNLKVLYISGYTDNAIVHHGILMEGIDLLQKPFTPDALVRKVREVLNR